jgi:hypothetical protein
VTVFLPSQSWLRRGQIQLVHIALEIATAPGLNIKCCLTQFDPPILISDVYDRKIKYERTPQVFAVEIRKYHHKISLNRYYIFWNIRIILLYLAQFRANFLPWNDNCGEIYANDTLPISLSHRACSTHFNCSYLCFFSTKNKDKYIHRIAILHSIARSSLGKLRNKSCLLWRFSWSESVRPTSDAKFLVKHYSFLVKDCRYHFRSVYLP